MKSDPPVFFAKKMNKAFSRVNSIISKLFFIVLKIKKLGTTINIFFLKFPRIMDNDSSGKTNICYFESRSKEKQ